MGRNFVLEGQKPWNGIDFTKGSYEICCIFSKALLGVMKPPPATHVCAAAAFTVLECRGITSD